VNWVKKLKDAVNTPIYITIYIQHQKYILSLIQDKLVSYHIVVMLFKINDFIYTKQYRILISALLSVIISFKI